MGGQAIVVATDIEENNQAALTFEQTFLEERKTDSLAMLELGQQLPDADVVVTLGSASTNSLVDVEAPTVQCMTLHAPEGSAALVLSYPIEDQLQLIRTVLPRSTRVGVVYSNESSAKSVERARSLVEDYGLELVEVRISKPAELSKAIRGLANRIDVLWGVADETLYNAATAETVLLFSFRQRVPFIGQSQNWVFAGAALGPAFDYQAIGRQCARIVGEVLDGTPAQEIGVRTPIKMSYSVNLNTLSKLNIAIADSVIEDAQHVY